MMNPVLNDVLKSIASTTVVALPCSARFIFLLCRAVRTVILGENRFGCLGKTLVVQ